MTDRLRINSQRFVDKLLIRAVRSLKQVSTALYGTARSCLIYLQNCIMSLSTLCASFDECGYDSLRYYVTRRVIANDEMISSLAITRLVT